MNIRGGDTNIQSITDLKDEEPAMQRAGGRSSASWQEMESRGSEAGASLVWSRARVAGVGREESGRMFPSPVA